MHIKRPIADFQNSNRTGFVPGEMIVFNAEIDNQSNRQINGSKLRLVEHVHYVTQRKTKSETKVVEEIDPGTSDMWEGVVMRIPAVLQTNLAGMYRKVANRSTSRLVAPPRIFRVLMNGKFDVNLLRPFGALVYWFEWRFRLSRL